MNHYRRVLVAIFGIALLSAVLAACGSPSPEPGPEPSAEARQEVISSPEPRQLESDATRPSAEAKQALRDALDRLKSEATPPTSLSSMQA